MMSKMDDNPIKPRQELERLLAKIAEQIKFDGAHLELASDARAEGLVDYLIEHFFPEETCCKSVGLVVDGELRARFLERFTTNLSILLISDISNEIIATKTIGIIEKEATAASGAWKRALKNNKAVTVQTFLSHRDSIETVFTRFEVGKAINFYYLSVRSDFRKKGIAIKMTEVAMTFCREMTPVPMCVKAVATSNISQTIYKKFDFEVLHEMKYDEYTVDGEIVFKNTGENKSVKVFVKQL